MLCNARIDSLYHGSAVDGQGLRCVVFFSGCNLRCPFCHNPETLYNNGVIMSVGEVKDRILKYKNYIKKGGVTLSGGEPFLQREFALELIAALEKEGIKTAAETNGTIIDTELIEKLDFIIVDVKNQLDEIYEDVYRKFLTAASAARKRVYLTNVLIPNVNDSEDKLIRLKKLKDGFPFVSGLKFLPFRKLCQEKYNKLNLPFLYRDMREGTKEDVMRAELIVNVLKTQNI